MSRNSKRSRAGLTLIEVMISLVILLIVFFGLMESARIAVEFNVRNAVRDEAVRVSQEALEQARNVPFASLSALALSGNPVIDNTVTRQIRLRNVPLAVRVMPATTGDVDAVQLTVTTTYQRTDGQDVTVTATSLVRNRPL